MDLTSLSSNLPRNNPSFHDENTESEGESLLMANFKQAALSVTTLYKSAAADLERNRREGRSEGYNDCLDDLLAVLAKIEGRADANTAEPLRQWALSRRRKVGRNGSRKDRADRDTSVESDTLTERPRSSSPPLPTVPEQPPPTLPTLPTKRSNPPPLARTTMNPPQFTFRTDQHLPRHMPPPPETVDVELPDTDITSPPTSPKMIPQNSFQYQSSRSNLQSGNGTPRRAGSKRRFGTINDFFDIAGMEKMHLGKKGRYF